MPGIAALPTSKLKWWLFGTYDRFRATENLSDCNTEKSPMTA
jgi:hypothetical protein